MEYLVSEGLIPESLAENGLEVVPPQGRRPK